MTKLTANFNAASWPLEIKEVSEKEIGALEERILKKDFDSMPVIAGRLVERLLQHQYQDKNEPRADFNELIKIHSSRYANPLLTDALYHVKRERNANAHPQDGLTSDYATSLYLLRAVATIFHYFFNSEEEFIFREEAYYKTVLEMRQAEKIKVVKKIELQTSINQNDLNITANPLWSQIEKSHFVFLIPFYQRHYLWNEEQVATLLEDLESRAEDGYLHYFGILAVKSKLVTNGNIMLRIIDGQQRLTTSLLLLKAAYDAIIESKTPPPKLLSNLFAQSGQFKNRYINKTADAEDSKELISILDHEIVGFHKGKTRYSKNYDLIKEYFLKKSSEDVDKLVSTFVSKFVIGQLNFEEPHQNREMDIFENLNSKGTPLSEWDLIRNHIFNLTSEEVKEEDKVRIMYDKFEKEFSIGIKKIDAEIGKLITEILYKESAKPNSRFKYKDYMKFPVYNNFKKCYANYRFEDEEQYTHFVLELAKYGQIYRALVSGDASELSNELSDITSSFGYLHKQVLFFIVMVLFDKYATYENGKWIVKSAANKSALETGIQILDICIQRYEIKVHFGTSWRQKTIAWAAALNSPKPLLTFLNTVQDDTPTKDAILVEDLEKSLDEKVAKKLLLRAQEVLVDDKHQYFKIIQKAPQLEHVMPQENSKWTTFLKEQSRDWEEKYDSHLNKLGNLYILPGKLNGSLQNEIFPVKKQKLREYYPSMPLIHGNHKYGLTGLMEINEWNFEQIDKRSKELAVFIVEHVLSLKKILISLQKLNAKCLI